MATFIFKNGKSKRIHTRNVEDDVVLTLPDEPGVVFTTNTTDDAISGKNQDPEYLDSVHAKYILKPDIGNNGGVRNENANITPLRRAAYITSSNFIGPLEYTEWEAYTDESLTNLLDSTTLVLHRDSWYPNTTALGLDVYVRYRFYSGEIRSPWSDIIHFKTPILGIEPFTVSVSESLMPTIRTSGFIVNGETSLGKVNHIATTYKIYDVLTNELVYSNEDDKVDLIEHTINKQLESDTEYYLEIFYTADNELVGDSHIVTYRFKTPNIYIETPVIEYIAGKNPITKETDPEYIYRHFIKSSAFSSSYPGLEHTTTNWKLYSITDDTRTRLLDVEDLSNLTLLEITGLLTEEITTLEVEVIYRGGDINSNVGKLRFDKKDLSGLPTVTDIYVNDITWDYHENTLTKADIEIGPTEVKNSLQPLTTNSKHSVPITTGPYVIFKTDQEIDNIYVESQYPISATLYITEKGYGTDVIGGASSDTLHTMKVDKNLFTINSYNPLEITIYLKDLKIPFVNLASPTQPRKLRISGCLEYPNGETNTFTVDRELNYDGMQSYWFFKYNKLDYDSLKGNDDYKPMVLNRTYPIMNKTLVHTRGQAASLEYDSSPRSVILVDPVNVKWGLVPFAYDSLVKLIANNRNGSYLEVRVFTKDKEYIGSVTKEYNADKDDANNPLGWDYMGQDGVSDYWYVTPGQRSLMSRKYDGSTFCKIDFGYNDSILKLKYGHNYYYYVTFYHPWVGRIGLTKDLQIFTPGRVYADMDEYGKISRFLRDGNLASVEFEMKVYKPRDALTGQVLDGFDAVGSEDNTVNILGYGVVINNNDGHHSNAILEKMNSKSISYVDNTDYWTVKPRIGAIDSNNKIATYGFDNGDDWIIKARTEIFFSNTDTEAYSFFTPWYGTRVGPS